MSSLSRPFARAWSRRRIALAMAAAILFAAFAQAAHIHKDELAGGGTDVQCTLCLFAASTAGPPAPLPLLPGVAPRYCNYRNPCCIPSAQRHAAVCYDARGPPAA